MITVYTCATNGRDSLRADQCVEGARFIAYADHAPVDGKAWEWRAAADVFRSPRRNARMHKVLSHQFVQSEYSVWMDANIALKVPARRLVDEYLNDADLAVFQHRARICTYDEADRCRLLGLDSLDTIDEQVRHYQGAGLAPGLGLPETSVVIRRHCAQVVGFNNAWWAEICRHSVRDQISFMFAAEKTGLKVNFILPTKYEHPYFSITNRPAGVEQLAAASTLRSQA